MAMHTDELVDFDVALEKYDPVLGFEVHVELNTKTKMFSAAPNVFGDTPNTNVTPVCLGLPGVLPVVNKTAVEYAILIGLALNCKIAERCGFARKNYFYPDTPKNFQTSQYDDPIAYDGWLDIELEDGEVFRVEIERAHMEEDAGKLTHMGGATGRIQGADYSLVDYNRSGVPLVEIVTKTIEGAGKRAPELAKAYVAAIREIVKSLDVSDAKMERGNVRCDANVSLMLKGADKFGTRTETKNVNSLRAVEHAVRFEIERHAAVLNSGAAIVQETRHWHEDTRTTTSGRPKSDADDYRYFPEPDLVPIITTVGVGRRAAFAPAGAAGRAPQAPEGRLGLLGCRVPRRRQRRRHRSHRGDHRRGHHRGRGPQVVDGRDRTPGQERRRRDPRPGRHPGHDRRAELADRGQEDQRQDRPPGARVRGCRRRHPVRGRGGAFAGRRQRRFGAGCRDRRRHGSHAGCR